MTAAGWLRATADFGAPADVDTVNICVRTALRKTKDPEEGSLTIPRGRWRFRRPHRRRRTHA